MKKVLVLLLLLLPVIQSLRAQNNNNSVLDGVYVKEHTLKRGVIPYPFIREADVFYKTRIWRVIDLKEKTNLPLYYPTSKIRDRKSLINVIMDAVNEGTLTAYKDEEFISPMTKAEVEAIGGSRVDTQMVTDPDPPYEQHMKAVPLEFSREWVIAYRIKEEWLFDKQRSVMEPRILGIAPMMLERDEKMNVRPDAKRVPLCWIYYPEARRILANAESFNRWNDAERKSFDDIFVKRMFGSYITKQSNVYDRRIEDYKTGMDALLEADKIKDDLVNFEHDLWEY